MGAQFFLEHDRVLPKEQRQGAINLLGMLALAKRSVLTDHVDVMLKVGLGRLGKVSSHLEPLSVERHL
jgi:hypothetical protein